jgi:SAM-dependent methyltransferase
VARSVGFPPATTRPYALPGAARLAELRWWLTLRTSRIVTAEDHCARVGMGEIEEVAHCTLCGERGVQPLFRPRRRGSWSYHVVRCSSCGLLYRNPGIRPERLGDLYAGDYGSFLTGRYAKRRRARYALVLDSFAPLFDDGRGRRLLDFGCGAGIFLELAHQRGFDGYGVDLSPDAVERARSRPGGANTHVGAPDEVPAIAAGGFDVVTMWSVLAHLPRPVEDFTTARRLLKPDGVLLVLTVNANSLLLKANGSRWGGFTPNHLKFYSPTTLPLLTEKAGFEALVLRPMYGDAIETGATALSPRQQRRLRRNVDRGNQANMLRGVAFADADGPRRWGLQA